MLSHSAPVSLSFPLNLILSTYRGPHPSHRNALTPYLIAEITSVNSSQNTYFTPNHYYHLILASAARSKKLKSMSERDKMQSAYKILSKFKAIEKEEIYKRNKNEVPLCF